MMHRAGIGLLCALLAVSAPAYAANILSNGSFESNFSSWTKDPSYTIQVVTSYSGVYPLPDNGNKFMVVSGPGTVGYSYAQIVSQSKSAPFGGDVPSTVTDHFVVYLTAYTYLHTNPGHTVSYALKLEPGYGLMSSTFYGGAGDTWVIAQTSGYYYAHDPFNASSSVKPMKVILELRDSLQSGEYLLLDNVYLQYGGTGVPEP
jgi:hypothetical protein